MSHKGIIGIIFVVSVITVGVYSTMALIEQQEPIQVLINSIQQDIVTETINTSDNVKLKVFDSNYERGRIPELSDVTINDTSMVSDDVILNTTGRSLSIVLYDGISATTVP